MKELKMKVPQKILSVGLLISLLSYPFLALPVKGGMNAAFVVATLLSIGLLAYVKTPFQTILCDRTNQLFALAMSAGALAILANQTYYQQFDPHPFDAELRFILTIFIFLALRYSDLPIARFLEYSFPLGVLATLLIEQISLTSNERLRTEFLDSIHVGGIAMMLGFLSLYSINWLGKDHKYLLTLKLFGFAAGIYLAIESGSRGVWIAIPVLFLFWYSTLKSKPFSIKTAFAITLIACLVSYAVIDMVRQRVDLAFSNYASYSNGHIDNGTAARLELWKVSIQLAKDSPSVGIQPGSLNSKLTAMRDAGTINNLVLDEGMAEMHSEIAARMAKYGMLGLVMALASVVILGWLSYKPMKKENQMARGAAQMGMCLVVGFFIFGLTVEVFNIKMVAAFYGLTTVSLFGIAHHITNNKS